jgi:hypothetical protein
MTRESNPRGANAIGKISRVGKLLMGHITKIINDVI